MRSLPLVELGFMCVNPMESHLDETIPDAHQQHLFIH